MPRTEFEESEERSDDDIMDVNLGGEEEGLEVLAGAGAFLAGLDKEAVSR